MFKVYTVDVRDQTIVVKAEVAHRWEAKKKAARLKNRIEEMWLDSSLTAGIFDTNIHDEKEFVKIVSWVIGLDTWGGRTYDWKVVEKHPLVEADL